MNRLKLSLSLTTWLLTQNVAHAQQVLTLDQCRQMALEHNQKVLIADKQVEVAGALKRSAQTQFLPSISANGLYTRTNKKFSLLDKDLMLPVIPYTAIDPVTGGLNSTILSPTLPDGTPNPNFNPAVFGSTFAIDPGTGQPYTDNEGNPLFQRYTWLPKDKAELGNKNVYVAGVNLTQPIFTGGKIRETYRIAKYGERLAQAQSEAERTEVLYKTEESYWRVAAVAEKVKLVQAYIALLEKLNNDLENYYAEGIIIKNDLLKVNVKKNKAELNLLKAQNRLTLSKMALCQQVGLPLNTDILIADSLPALMKPIAQMNYTDSALARRPEIEALNQTINIAKSGVNLGKSRYMPNIGLTANYMFFNPNPYNGLTENFGGDWSVGVAINVPIFHWNDRGHTLKAARSEQRVAELKMDEAKELISLQVQQAIFQLNESIKKVEMAQVNLKQAEENLKVTRDAFETGRQKTSDVLEAQAMWQNAYSELIDARMEYRLNVVNLKRVTGSLK
ncbi:MAG TPA: TolC family protein [Bacteroidales bacterium]|nr:TolC family protein [Bacteroidales bacterium]